ncbi:amino acid ABC transporter permease [Kribbella speibonae]|uniref:Amino acid ABC transporter permease n=1 Tax=Kribbella speibonae TaxID=1572660 RepID=A0A4R0IT50_9ACTN|nr:amino acid ABC transporter permease [Kribbella speibonae]TCC36369.1 amino acid ABC transporter permease [Kribbella speibonae]
MPDYNFDWGVVRDAWPQLLSGLGTTLQIAVITIILSMILAIPVAVARMSAIGIVRWIAQIYIEIFRCTPMLVQLFWIYYALPALTGITIPGYLSAVIALTANLTAFMAEAYRSGFQAVPVEQIEAGKMLRLTRFQQLRFIIVPQALRQQVPVILSLNISMFKDTALVSTIAVHDLMFAANTAATQSYRALELFTTAAAVYFCIAFPVSLLTSFLERRGQLARTGRAPLPKLRKPAETGAAR